MRLLKAFIRVECVDTVVRALRTAGAPGVTISHVHAVGYEYDPRQDTFAPGVEGKAPEVAKIEVVCLGEDADRLLRTIVETAGRGCRGDGIVFVTAVERTVKIRDGAEGRAALQT
jgi:nitrogen regulatory protein P-II 1